MSSSAPTPTRSSLAAGDFLTPPNYITSPSGDFSFGFRTVDKNPNSFLLAIWFRLDAGRGRVVWFAADPAGSGSAVVAAGRSVLKFTSAGQLSLLSDTDSNNAALLWSPYAAADPSRQNNNNYGSLLALRDTGNLQFLAADGETVVWESFGHPTDTLLPGQVMSSRPSSGRGRTSLRSRASDTDFSAGRFSFVMGRDGNMVWYRTDLPGGDGTSANAYWSTRSCCVGDGNTTLFFDADLVGHLYYRLADGTRRNLTAPQPIVDPSAGGGRSRFFFFYQHATLDPDGVLRVYILPRNGTAAAAAAWSAVKPSVPSGGCQAVTNGRHGMCGPNSYCVYGGADDNRLDCECLSGYTLLHAQSRYGGCAPSFAEDSCDDAGKTRRSHASEFKLVELPNTRWVNTIFYEQHQPVTAEKCQDLCLHNCLCAAVLFDGSSSSCLEAAMLSTGWQQNGTSSMRTLVKVRTKGPPAVILPYAVIAGLGMLLLATACIFLVHCYVTNKKERNRKHLSVTVFTRKELRRATNGFSKLLGQGGFGKVYHGIVKSIEEPHEIAVKELRSADEYQETEFENEVQSIGRIHHRNLVRMVGYCKEGVHRMLVFEFMPGGSLGDVLFNPSDKPSWSWRAEAAMDIARGLEYLHYGCTAQIVHCDIKPDNILLDDRRVPKITDFGIARLLDGDKLKQTITHVRGTLGYLAPEWFSSEGKVDSKVDVFSFGVVLLEMICCRKYPPPPPPLADGGQDGPRCSHDHDDDSEDRGMAVTLRAWMSDLVREGHVGRAVQGDMDAQQDLERVERFVRIAIWCVQGDPSLRPTMRRVVWMMESTMEVDPLPVVPPAPRDHDFPADAASSGTHDNSNSNSIYHYD